MLGRAWKALAGAALLAGLSAAPALGAPLSFENDSYVASPAGSPQDLTLGDLDADGLAEIVVGVRPQFDTEQPFFTTNFNQGDGTYFAVPNPTGVPTGEGVEGVSIGDLDRDGFGDVATGNTNGIGIVYFGDGEGGFPAALNLGRTEEHPDQPITAPVIGRFTADRDADVVSGNQGPLTFYAGDGARGVSEPEGFDTGVNATDTVAADLDRDGDRDVLVSGFSGSGGFGGALALLINNGKGKFKPPSTLGLGNGPVQVAAANVAGSRKLEVIARSPSEDSVSVYPLKRKGKLGKAKAYPVAGGGGGIAVGDLDGDRRADVATGDGSAQISVLRGKRTGGFRDFESVGSIETVGDLAISDLDDDGDLDLAGLGAQAQVLINQAVG